MTGLPGCPDRASPDELDDARVVHTVTDRSAEPGEEGRGGTLPVLEEILLSFVEEDVAEPVPPSDEPGRDARRQGVRGEHIEITTFGEGGERQLVDETRRTGRENLATRSRARSAGASGGEAEEVGVVVELEDASDRFEHLGGRVAVAPLLQAQVVLDADAGEHCDLFSAQAGNAANTEHGDAHLLGGDELASGSEVLPQGVRLVGHVDHRTDRPQMEGSPCRYQCRGGLGIDVAGGKDRAVALQIHATKGLLMSHVLVTGGSGFIAGHVIVQLLEQGHTVRSTIRSLRKETVVRTVLRDAGATSDEALTFVEADLMNDAGWADAVTGMDFVIHLASPIHTGKIKDEQEVIAPARDGALRVLGAARDAGVARVVLTSAFHAVGFGHGHIDHVFTEEDWSPLNGPGVDAYGRSKVLAEKAAWDFVAPPDTTIELATILPVAVMGPVMGDDVSGANHIVQNMLKGEMSGVPNMFVPIVDVRDVAAAHIAAMTAPGAAGQRFLVGTGEPAIAMKEIGAILTAELGEKASKIPTRSIPNVAVRLSALFQDEFKSVAADLGYIKRVSNTKTRTVLGITPRPAREAILAAGRSMIARGLTE